MKTSRSITIALTCFLALVLLGIAIPIYHGAFASADMFLVGVTPYWEISQSLVKACVYVVLVSAGLTSRLLLRLNKSGIYTLSLGAASATTAVLGSIQEPLIAFATMILGTVAVIQVFEASRKGDFGTSNEQSETANEEEAQ